MAVVSPGAAGRDLDQALTAARLEGRQQAGRALAHVCAALPPGPPRFSGLLPVGRLGRYGLDRLVVEYAGALIEAHDGQALVVGPLIDGQHVLHPRHEGGVHRPQAWGCNLFF